MLQLECFWYTARSVKSSLDFEIMTFIVNSPYTVSYPGWVFQLTFSLLWENFYVNFHHLRNKVSLWITTSLNFINSLLPKSQQQDSNPQPLIGTVDKKLSDRLADFVCLARGEGVKTNLLKIVIFHRWKSVALNCNHYIIVITNQWYESIYAAFQHAEFSTYADFSTGR